MLCSPRCSRHTKRSCLSGPRNDGCDVFPVEVLAKLVLYLADNWKTFFKHSLQNGPSDGAFYHVR